MKDLNKLTSAIKLWSTDRNLHTQDHKMQTLKFGEEAGELFKAIVKNDTEELIDAVGELNCVDTVFETDGVSYIDTAVSVMQVYDLIDKLDEPTKVEPLVVPKELGEWLCCYDLGDERSLFTIIGNLRDMWTEGDSEEFIGNNKKKLIEVILGNRPYEVEKEKLYYVIDKSRKPILTIHEGKVIASVSVSKVERAEKLSTPDFKYRLTEKQIKDYDERYWLFAVEVAE